MDTNQTMNTCAWCGQERIPGLEPFKAAPARACPRCHALFLDGLPPDAALARFFQDAPARIRQAPSPRFRGAAAPAAPPPMQSDLLAALERSGMIAVASQASPAAMPRFRGAAAQPAAGSNKATLAVMFTDIQGSTSYFAERGDDAGFAMIERHNSLLFPVLQAHQGIVIKTIGDAIMGCFPQPTHAAAAAVQMQIALRDHNADQTDPLEQLHVRIGVHFGEAIVSRSDPSRQGPTDIFGNLVNVASRIESLARGDEILVSHEVASQVDGPVKDLCQSLGHFELKGVPQPLEVFSVDWKA